MPSDVRALALPLASASGWPVTSSALWFWVAVGSHQSGGPVVPGAASQPLIWPVRSPCIAWLDWKGRWWSCALTHTAAARRLDPAGHRKCRCSGCLYVLFVAVCVLWLNELHSMSTSTTATIHTYQFCTQLSTKHPQVTGHSVREQIRELLQGFCHAYDASSSLFCFLCSRY